jgi:hypothetical protein
MFTLMNIIHALDALGGWFRKHREIPDCGVLFFAASAYPMRVNILLRKTNGTRRNPGSLEVS